MRDTWYVLEDGSRVHPSEVAPDKSGVLTHKNGPVAIGSHGNPRTAGVDVDEHGKLVKIADDKDGKAKEATAEADKAGYKTRETKAK